MREPCPLLLPKADSYWRGSNLHCGPAKTIDFDVDQSAIYSHDSSGFPVTERAEGLAASKFPERSHHEYVAQRSGRTKWLPALFLPRLASDPPGEDLERRLCLDIQAWPRRPVLRVFTCNVSTSDPGGDQRGAASCPIVGELNVGLVCSACGRTGAACGCNRRYGFAAMRVVDNDGLLRGPADPKCINIHSPAEMRHWAREIGQSAAKLNEAVRAVGPLVSNVRDYLRKHSLYGRPR